MSCWEFKKISCNPTMEAQVKLVRDVIYSTQTGVDLPMSLLIPWNVDAEEVEHTKKPLIVFVQGSAWTTPDRDFEIPQLAGFARKGYVVATIVHRDAAKGHAFPAYLQDVKCAIRYLRKHADQYGIDPEHVAVWGTSSGGNAALLVGLTGDDPVYKTEEYSEYSDAVNVVAECFGPTDIPQLMKALMAGRSEEPSEGANIFMGLAGGDLSKVDEIAEKMSPIFLVEEGKTAPPCLLLHGDADPLVPFAQMTSLYEKMKKCGYTVEGVQIEGAVHEGNFWSDEVYETIESFIKKYI